MKEKSMSFPRLIQFLSLVTAILITKSAVAGNASSFWLEIGRAGTSDGISGSLLLRLNQRPVGLLLPKSTVLIRLDPTPRSDPHQLRISTLRYCQMLWTDGREVLSVRVRV